MEHIYFRNREDRETDNWNNLTEEERNFKQQKMAEDNKDMKTTNRLRSELSESKELVEVSKISDVKEFERLTDKHINWGCFINFDKYCFITCFTFFQISLYS